ncbi:hypothetical protein HFD88_009504 [Aspergillus terreus]|nr:hypothetical protein HFD88_009504 [Aspergillus terreus]
MRRALLTAVSLTLFSLAALAEIVPYEETLTHRENSIASVRLDINFLGLGPLQASYPTFGECVSLSTPPAEKYVRIDSVGPVDPECVMYRYRRGMRWRELGAPRTDRYTTEEVVVFSTEF